MTHGLRQIPAKDWAPGRYLHIAFISPTMESLATKHGFKVERHIEDGIGWVSYVFLELGDGTRFILEWAEQGKSGEVVVNASIADKPYGKALNKLLAALGLDRSVVLWQSEEDAYDELIESSYDNGSLD